MMAAAAAAVAVAVSITASLCKCGREDVASFIILFLLCLSGNTSMGRFSFLLGLLIFLKYIFKSVEINEWQSADGWPGFEPAGRVGQVGEAGGGDGQC